MICFEVQVNGVKICTAGTGEFGVLTSGLAWVNNRQEPSVEDSVNRVSLNVGGLTIPENDSGEFVTWVRQDLKVGDEVRMRVVEAIVADEPVERQDREPHCSFCGKVASKVSKIIEAQHVKICNECVAVCNQVITENKEPRFGDSAA